MKIAEKLKDPTDEIHLLTHEQVHQKYAGDHRLDLFIKNYSRLLKEMGIENGQEVDLKKRKGQLPKWNASNKGYRLLFNLHMNPEETRIHEMTPEQIYKTSKYFYCYPLDTFTTYNKNMVERTAERRLQNDKNLKDFHWQQQLYPRNEITKRGYPFWDTHKAKVLLTEDVKNHLHKTMRPKELYYLRAEYQDFPLSCFRKHIYQEASKQIAAPYWNVKRNKMSRRLRDEEDDKEKEIWFLGCHDYEVEELTERVKASLVV